jgi:hypothetical protein
MANDKKPNQAKNKKYADPKTGEFRHSDGDRRHRLGASAKDAIKHKQAMQEQGGLPPEVPNETDEWDESEIWDEPDDTDKPDDKEGGKDA